ncbi:Retrovirus-related Pol polyprotein, partial [Mucuna pruriens]
MSDLDQVGQLKLRPAINISLLPSPPLELKPLPGYLKYVYLENDQQFLVIIGNNLHREQEEKLLQVLRQHKKAIGWRLGIEVDKSKIDIITSLPNPASVREVRSFLGHAGFYRRFIQNFSKIALPLSKLLQKGVDFNFDQPCIEAFQELKIRLTSTPILQAPNWEYPFELMCDASNSTLGAVLGQ